MHIGLRAMTTVGSLALLASAASAATLSALSIQGPDEISEGASGSYRVRAAFSNGTEYEVTLFTQFAFSPAQAGAINQLGLLTASQVDGDVSALLSASFSWEGVTLSTLKTVKIIDTSGLGCAAPDYFWARTFGGIGVDAARRVVFDGAGGFFVAGSFEATADFDPGPGVASRTSNGAADAYISRFSADGAWVWTRTFGGSGADALRSIALSLDGDLLACGSFTGTVDFDPGAGTASRTSLGSDDAFVLRLTGAGDFVWVNTVGGVGSDDAFDVTVDVAGSVLVAGGWQFVADFNPSPAVVDARVAKGARDLFVWKLSPAGGHEWAYGVGGGQIDEAFGIDTDPNRDIFVVGRFSSTIDFDPGPAQVAVGVSGATDAFVVRLAANGALHWARALGGVSTDGAHDIDVASNGDVVLGGYFWDTADFNPGAGVNSLTSAGFSDGFVCRLNAAGEYLWARPVGGSGGDEVLGVTLDAEERILATGVFEGTVDFDSGSGVAARTSAGSDDAFVLKLGASGAFSWVVSGGGPEDDQPFAIAADGFGRVIYAGGFRGTANFNPNGASPVGALGATDAFLVRLQCGEPLVSDPFACAQPAFESATPIGGAGADAAVRVVRDLAGATYVAGSFQGAVDFDPGPGVDARVSSGGSDVFVTRFEPGGAYGWTRSWGGAGDDYARGLALGQGGVHVAGSFSSSVDFDPSPTGQAVLTSLGGLDIFVSKLTDAGEFAWARSAGGSAPDEAADVAVAANGQVIAAGYFQSTADFDPGAGVDNRLSKGGRDVYAWSLSADGSYLWTFVLGSSHIDEAKAVAVHGAARAALTGRFQAIVDADPGPGILALQAIGGTDIFVIELNLDRTLLRAAAIGGVSTEEGQAAEYLPDGSLAIAGSFWGAVDFDPTAGVDSRTSAGKSDAFVMRFDSAGQYLWTRTAGGAENDDARSVTGDPSGSVIAVGRFVGEARFDDGDELLLSAVGGADAFAWKLRAGGEVAWAASWGGFDADDATDVAADRRGAIAAAGYFTTAAVLDPWGTELIQGAGGTDGFLTLLRCGDGISADCVGDMNCDGAVTFGDIDLFVIALQGPDVWALAYPNCPWLNADCNFDSDVSFTDIGAFVVRIGEPCSTTAIQKELGE